MINISMFNNNTLGDVMCKTGNSYKKCLTKRVEQRKIYPALCAEIKIQMQRQKNIV